MNIKTSPWVILAAFTFAGAETLALPQSTWAQTCSAPQNLQGCNSPYERGSFSSSSGGDFSVYDIIHRAQMGTLTNLDDFTAEQRENLNSAAEKFRAQQLKRIQEAQQQTASDNPARAPIPQP
ncbi:MAG: hypothetical protein N3E45_11160 [Oscillatoriaceae bacterium SKW80]|nr:hypothetical protein [Oscillatoriaceae bacterium SKYG93]MCX8121366.1 hypothetical protein [Oscillatoriaceae bacterium SKW80]MDW8451958.1 hypothetical protein [Oscillatoriaceae cyanobacterium SKYGB_i_bin93]HIK29499.1 hypothetical protein [Oscillatoriaceae cyanobacterium M7585_C2015_266]